MLPELPKIHSCCTPIHGVSTEKPWIGIGFEIWMSKDATVSCSWGVPVMVRTPPPAARSGT